jgi:hypothetical protein
MLRTLALLAVVSAPLAAQNALDQFTGGTNQGNWTFGANSAVQMSGGNPGACLRTTNLDTFAPQLRTQGASAFTGNWRTMGVKSVGVDLITISTQFNFQRECTLMLSNGQGTVYQLGTDFVPQPGTGWKSVEFLVDTKPSQIPANWAVLGPGNPDAIWNAVVTNVTSITFFYGDPTFFFIFDIWNIGADNLRISAQPVWTNLGQGLAGAGGTPALAGKGQLVAGSQTKLEVTGAAPSAPATLIVGFTAASLPFKGGTLVPTPNVLITLATSPAGAINLTTPWPAGIPSGTSIWMQTWVSDAGGPKGFAATNGVKATTP